MSTDGRPPVFKVIGIVLAVSSGLFIGVSFVLKKVGLLKANAKYNEEAGEGYGYLKNAYWWSGMTLMILGEICNFVAYAFVDAILVTPLGALSVVVTTILSAIFLKERLSFVGKAACFLCIIGSVIIVVNAPQQSSVKDIQQMQHFFITPGFLSYAGVIIVGCVCVVFFVAPKYGKKSMLVYLTICSLIGGLSVVCIQGLGAAVTAQAGGETQYNQWFLWVLLVFVICTLVTEIIYLNKALNLFNAALVTPTYYVYFTSATIISSAVLFQGFSGTPIEILTIVMGFLVICTGVVLLQLAKSSKDVPDSKVFTGDLDDVRTIAEQEQPESEPKADALRGTAAIVRRLSQSRQKWEEAEARRVQEDKMKDQLEPINENEEVEWDGLRRRKTVRADPGELQRRKSMRPPLGMSQSMEEEDETEEQGSSRIRSPSFFQFGRRNSNARSPSTSFGSIFPHRPEETIMEDAEYNPDGKSRAHANSAESHEMGHVYGLPAGLEKSQKSLGSAHQGRPIQWASDVEDRPTTGKSSNHTLAPPTPRSGNRRQFSFQNMFARHRGEELPRTPVKETHGPILKGATEEERLGLVIGDSRRPSAENSEDEKGDKGVTPVSTNDSTKPILKKARGQSPPQKQRQASRSDAAAHEASQPYVQQGPGGQTQWSSSTPDFHNPPPQRPLPDTPQTQQGSSDMASYRWPMQNAPAVAQSSSQPRPPSAPTDSQRATPPGTSRPGEPAERRVSPERVRVVTGDGSTTARTRSNTPPHIRINDKRRQGSADSQASGKNGPGGAAFI